MPHGSPFKATLQMSMLISNTTVERFNIFKTDLYTAANIRVSINF
jgi:hypothetical protein